MERITKLNYRQPPVDPQLFQTLAESEYVKCHIHILPHRQKKAFAFCSIGRYNNCMKVRIKKTPPKTCQERKCDNYQLIAAHLRLIVKAANICLHDMTGEKYIKEKAE